MKQQVDGYLAVPPGIHCSIHVTTAMSMKTQRDAFITSLAKFTSLHSAAYIWQKIIEVFNVCSAYLVCPISCRLIGLQQGETPLCSFSSSHVAVAKPANYEGAKLQFFAS